MDKTAEFTRVRKIQLLASLVTSGRAGYDIYKMKSQKKKKKKGSDLTAFLGLSQRTGQRRQRIFLKWRTPTLKLKFI